MHRFFVSPQEFRGETVTLDGPDIKHILKVLRMKPGDKIIVSDGNGWDYLVKLTGVSSKHVTADILSKGFKEAHEPSINVFQALPKGQKMDLVVEKATELGVQEIVPIIVERTVVKLNKEKEEKKYRRWQHIGVEAAKQSQRSYLPHVKRPIGLKEALKELERFDLTVVPWEEEKRLSLKRALPKVKVKSVAVVIGPEGGFAKDEIEELRSVGAKVVTLGEQILRTETAALAVLSIVAYHFGLMGDKIS